VNKFQSRHPLEYLVPLFLALAGISTMTYAGPPRTIDMIMGGASLTIWSLMLTIGSLTTFVGVVWRGRYIVALGIEQVGEWLIAGTTLIYVIALVTVAGFSGWLPASITLSICLAYVWQITRVMKISRRIVNASHPKDKKGEE
jgi:hypothetical protein